MRGNNVLGIIFSNMKDSSIRELTEMRTMGSVPFGARYRLIDFALSNMTNSGIERVGIVTKNNYRSLMDHVGSGKVWDLSRKRSGIVFLPPYGEGNSVFENRLGALAGIKEYLASCNEEYVFLTDCDVVCNIDIADIVKDHISQSADITIVYSTKPQIECDANMLLKVDPTQRVTDILLKQNSSDGNPLALGMYVMRREFLLRVINESIAYNYKNFQADVLQSNLLRYRIYGYEHKGYVGIISSLSRYYQLNMELLESTVREELFSESRPIYTKIRDEMPARYGLGSDVRNSLVADGCVIEGKVENCILFRGVRIGKGVSISNSIVMQGSQIGDGCDLSYLIVDKNVVIRPDRRLMGFESYPVFINKGSII